jgi:N-acetylglucosaminyldiphosphoundecaprenol N-acetyl-beta-D-mannosaminyltransferase
MSTKPREEQANDVQQRVPIVTPGRRHSLLGISLDVVTGAELIGLSIAQVETGSGCLLFGNHNLHSLHLFHKSSEMRRFYAQCDLTHVDGMSLIALGRCMGLPLNRSHRTTYLDWIHDFLAEANTRGWRLYVIGGTPEFADALPSTLHSSFPCLQVATHHGYIGAADDDAVLQQLTAFSPDVVMVGMGMPQQEAWIVRNRHRVTAKVIFNCGAAYEYLVGAKKTPPRWAGQLGIEWLFRLVTEPRRLARRYLVEPIFLIPLIAQAVIAHIGSAPTLARARSRR